MFIEKIHQHKADYHGDVRTLITGLSFQCPKDWESILESLDSKSDITIKKEPENEHDEHAIAAYLGDRRIGYVSKDDNCAIYMFMGDEPIRCEVIEKYNASFKVSFEHPKKAFENFTPEQIFQLQPDCEYKGYDKDLPSYEIPILEVGDDSYDWYDDTIVIPNMENWIVDFKRKFVSNKIELVCRQASDGSFYYYLPYLNWDIAEVGSQEICDELERLGKGIALVEAATLTYQNTIVAELKVGLRKDYSGISAMSFFKMKRENKDFNFIYEKPQETHANIAIASSNILGKGPGNSDERDYLQEASCDFIYAIIIEELGMAGGIAVMLVYIILLFRVGRIATRCKEKYPAYLAMGLGMLLGLQAFINMSVAVGLFPVTGQPLPLISKGGTSILMTSGCIGMLLGISNTLEREAAGEYMMGKDADLPKPVDGDESFE